MSVKIKNNLDLIIYFGIDDEEKLPIMDKEYQDLTKETKEYTLRLSEIYEDFQDKIYKFTPPCVISVDEGFVVNIEKNGKKSKLSEAKPKKEIEEKKVEEEPKEEQEEKEDSGDSEDFPELKSKKQINLITKSLTENESYVFLENDYSKIYKFVGKEEEKFEIILESYSKEKKDNEEDKKVTINYFEKKISPFIKLNCKFIFFDNRILHKSFVININDNYEKILEKISEEINLFIGSKDYRVIYKEEDITLKELDKKSFVNIQKGQNNNNKINSEILSSNENMNYIEDFSGDLFLQKGEKINEKQEKKEEKKEEKNEEKSETNIEEKEKDIEEKEKDSEEKPEEKKEESLKEKFKNSKTFCETGFDFENDNFIFVFPESQFKLCNFYNYQTYWYEARNTKVMNVFAFDKNITIKNLNIAGSTGNLTYLKLTIYESSFDKNQYLNKEGMFEKTDKLKEASFWSKQKEIFESSKIKCVCLYRKSDDELLNICDYYTFLETPNLKIKKNRVYGFVFELGPNTEYNYLYFNSKDSCYSEFNEELNISYYTSKDSYCFLSAFNYKIDY